jgi:hypothetical protein
MNTNDSGAVITAAGKDGVLNVGDSGYMQLAQAATQKTTAVVEVPTKGKGGFSAIASIGELIEFQFTGLLVVFVVLGALTLVCNLIAQVLKVVAPDQYYGHSKPAPIVPAKPVAHAPAQPVAVPVAVAASAPKTIHPGLSDEKLLAILAVAAQEAVGQAVSVVKFRHMGSMDWTWSVQGRVGLHSSHKL